MKTYIVAFFSLVLSLLLMACSSAPQGPASSDTNDLGHNFSDLDFSDERDPFEDFNRSMWRFNRDVADPYLILPLANTYEKVPAPARHALSNFATNLMEPVYFINNVLQLKFGDAGRNIQRFTMNTTLGFLGLADVASSVGIYEKKENLGQTAAVYGVPDGPYLMLPVAGPTVVIDRGGDVIDAVIWPSLIYGWPFALTKYVLSGLNQRIALKELEPMLENSLDDYSFVREAYFASWKDKVHDGNPPKQADDWNSGWDDEWNQTWEPELKEGQKP